MGGGITGQLARKRTVHLSAPSRCGFRKPPTVSVREGGWKPRHVNPRPGAVAEGYIRVLAVSATLGRLLAATLSPYPLTPTTERHWYRHGWGGGTEG